MSLEYRKKPMPEISIIPLINVVFLLLIFFLVAGTAIDAEEGVVALPESVVRTEGVAEAEIMVSLLSSGKLMMGGDVISEDALKTVLANTLGRQVAVPVMLRADASVAARKLIGLLKLVRQAGATDVFIATRDVSED